MPKKMNPVVHFEMPAKDRSRMSKFYQTVFGWETNQLGAEMNNYVVVMTGPTDEKTNRPTEPGFINGGFYDETDDPLSKHPSVVIDVPDVNEAIKEIKAAGGKILSEPMQIPGVGIFASFEDTEGNRVSILQSNM